MFGYVIPDKMNMYMKDFYVYKAHYCGLCKRIGKDCGQLMRFSTNYDMVFLDLLVHDILGLSPVYNNEGCILSPKKKSIARGDEVTDLIVDVNTLLMHCKLADDKVDSKHSGKKGVADALVVKGKYKKARERHPELDNLYDREYARLREYEQANESSIDKLSDPFASMLRDTVKYILKDKSSETVEELMYNLGKWVYIIDAADDVDKDYKKGEFNPFLIDYEYTDLDKFYIDNGERLEFLLKSCYNRICELFSELKLSIHEGAITNIIWYGILYRTEDLLGRKGECQKIRI